MPVDAEAYCLLCECQYEERSTTTIKVSVHRPGLRSRTFRVALGLASGWACPRHRDPLPPLEPAVL